jgi:4-carboxymuconolactone decarboxylase
VDAALYSAAERAFGHRGLVEITYLTGAYHTVCALLNAFEIPAPR